MAKDPAFLFYSQDWVVGCQALSMQERGQYITLICMMHQQGRLDEETIRLLVGSISDRLKSKFKVDKSGLWYNERLETESLKRSKFTESRRNNGLQGGRPVKNKQNHMVNGRLSKSKPTHNHMGNENEDVNSSSNTTTSSNNNINVRVQKFVDTVNSTFDRKFQVTEKVKGNFKARILKYSSKEILDVIHNLKKSTWHIDTNFRYCTPEFILREQKIELYKSGPIIDSKNGKIPKQDAAKTEEKHADFYESQRG